MLHTYSTMGEKKKNIPFSLIPSLPYLILSTPLPLTQPPSHTLTLSPSTLSPYPYSPYPHPLAPATPFTTHTLTLPLPNIPYDTLSPHPPILPNVSYPHPCPVLPTPSLSDPQPPISPHYPRKVAEYASSAGQEHKQTSRHLERRGKRAYSSNLVITAQSKPGSA